MGVGEDISRLLVFFSALYFLLSFFLLNSGLLVSIAKNGHE